MIDDTPHVDAKLQSSMDRLRLWPAVLIVVAIGLARTWASFGEMTPFKFFIGYAFVPAVGTILLHLWWLFGSRLRWFDRLLVFGVFLATAVTTFLIADENFPTTAGGAYSGTGFVAKFLIAGKNSPAIALLLYALPVVATLWVVWLVVSSPLRWPIRRLGHHLQPVQHLR